MFLGEKQSFPFANFLHLFMQGAPLTHSAMENCAFRPQALIKWGAQLKKKYLKYFDADKMGGNVEEPLLATFNES